MAEYQERTDLETEATVREALLVQRAFGDAAARTFLELRGVNAEVAARVISAPLRMIRRFWIPPQPALTGSCHLDAPRPY